MTYFLQDVAEYLYKRNNGDLRTTIIVFPNRRARLFFNHFLSQIAVKPLWVPEYYTISDFIQKLSGLQLADPLTLLFRLYKVFVEITSSKESFDNFYYYCEIILADFDDIDKCRVNAEILYKNLSDLKAIDNYKDYLEKAQIDAIQNFWNILINSKKSNEKEKFLSIWDALGSIYTEFGNSLEKDGLAYEGRAYRKAVDKINSGIETEIVANQVVFVGFNALNHSEELLFDKFRARGNTLFFWDYDEYYINSDLYEAGLFLKNYLRRYSQPVDFSAGSHTSFTEQKITTIAVPSTISQAKIIDKCIEITGSDTIESPLKTALILADESLLMPVINSLPAEISEVNISMGYPVIDTPAMSFIVALTNLHKNRRKDKKREGEYEFYHSDLFSVLNHALLAKIADKGEIRLFRKTCRQKNLVYINPLESNLKDPVVNLLFRTLHDPVEFGRYLREIIELIAERTRSVYEPSVTTKWKLEILFAIHKVLMRFEVLIKESGIEFTFSNVLNLLRRILEGISVPFTGEPLSGLQIMGILETRTLDFENLILLSMNEGKFPKSDHIPSLIPFALREAFRLPTINHQDAIFGYYFYRLLHRSRNIVLVYNTRTEGIQKGEPSRFILQLRYERPVSPFHLDMGYEIGPLVKKKIIVTKTDKVFEILKKYQPSYGNLILSPSALNTYLDCSLKFYFRYIEEINEPDDINEQIETDVFGRILHRAMSILYKPFYNKECNVKEIDMLRKDKDLINRAIDQAFADEYFRKNDINRNDFQGLNLIIRKVIEQYVNGILLNDMQSAPFTILSVEEKYSATIKSGNILVELRIGGYIDRLDVKDGIVRIIDYKTGRRNSEFTSVESLFSRDDEKRNGAVFQTFLYSWIMSKEKPDRHIQPLLYYIREIYHSDFTPEIIQSENRRKNSVDNFSNFRSEFEEGLTGLLSELFDSSVPFLQTDNLEQCKRCPYNEICLRPTE